MVNIDTMVNFDAQLVFDKLQYVGKRSAKMELHLKFLSNKK